MCTCTPTSGPCWPKLKGKSEQELRDLGLLPEDGQDKDEA